MSLIALILLTLAAWLGIKLLIRLHALFKIYKGVKSQFQRQFNAQPQQAKRSDPKRMVKCQTCDVYIPESDAIQQYGKKFCSQTHAETFNTKNH